MDLALLFVYFAAVFWYATRTDQCAERLLGLALDGRALPGWRIVKAASFANRRAGLLNHAAMAPQTGLLLAKGRSVHTVGMLCSIDLVFLDRKGTVLSHRGSVPPGERRIAGPRGTRMILELPAGAVGEGLALQAGSGVGFPTPLPS